MPFDPTKTGLWDRKPHTVDDFALTVVSMDPRMGIITFKVGGEFHDFLIGPGHAEELAETLLAMRDATQEEAEANDQSPPKN